MFSCYHFLNLCYHAPEYIFVLVDRLMDSYEPGIQMYDPNRDVNFSVQGAGTSNNGEYRNLKIIIADQNVTLEAQRSEIETLKTQILIIKDNHRQVLNENEIFHSKLSQLQQTTHDTIDKTEKDRNMLMEEIGVLRSQQITPERVDMIRAEMNNELEATYLEKIYSLTAEIDQQRQEFNKMKSDYIILKSEYDNDMRRQTSLREEAAKKYEFEIKQITNEKDKFLTQINLESESDANQLRNVARENDFLKQKLLTTQKELDKIKDNGDDRILELNKLSQEMSFQITEAAIHIASLDAEKSTLLIQLENLQGELLKSRNKLQETVREAAKDREALEEAHSKLEDVTHIHRMEISDLEMTMRTEVDEVNEHRNKLIATIRSQKDQLNERAKHLYEIQQNNCENEKNMAQKIQSVKEEEWSRVTALQDEKITLEAKVGELEMQLNTKMNENTIELENMKEKLHTLQNEFNSANGNNEQLKEQIKELKQQLQNQLHELQASKTDHKKHLQLQNQYKCLLASEQNYKETNEQLATRCNLLDEEFKNLTLTHEKMIEEFDASQKKTSDELGSEINKLVFRLQEYSTENDHLKQKIEKVLKAAKKMKITFKNKLTQLNESLKSIKEEKEANESTCKMKNKALEAENKRLNKKIAQMLRRQTEFQFIMDNQTIPNFANIKLQHDGSSVTSESPNMNLEEIEFLHKKIDALTARQSEALADLNMEINLPTVSLDSEPVKSDI